MDSTGKKLAQGNAVDAVVSLTRSKADSEDFYSVHQ